MAAAGNFGWFGGVPIFSMVAAHSVFGWRQRLDSADEGTVTSSS